jgi:GT2 family glycosyltransferase
MVAVTYGPFPGGWPATFTSDFTQMVTAGFNAIRLYELPDVRLLDAAAAHGLKVFGGLKWGQSADFLGAPGLYSAAVVSLAAALREMGMHPALAGIYVGNEIPADLVRWMGPLKVRRAIEQLIEVGRKISPQLLFAYANYPSTEYLEPENADFSAFNVYLESEGNFANYLRRLHHIAGDRPLVISEFGLDSQRNGLVRQAETLRWASQVALDLETAGMTFYAWSDRWWNNGAEVLDWDFGLLDRSGEAKPALSVLRPQARSPSKLRFSVIVCTRNGRSRIGSCLAAIRRNRDAFETLVVDDGSVDGTADLVRENFPWVRLITLPASGLSAARNAGAAAALGDIFAFTDDDCEPDGEWLSRLAVVFEQGDFAAVGGPNLPPKPQDWQQAVVCAAPGAPSHVLLDDTEAEHLPGCNLAVRRSAFEAVGGFDPQFHTAGDDVDFCWRLRDAGLRLGFAAGAFVWHWRRPSVLTFLRQQLGYGRAERLLLGKHPTRFCPRGGARWQGFIYGGGAVRVMADSVIYHGPLGEAGFQGITNRVLPLRGLEQSFAGVKAQLMLQVVKFLQPRIRAWARNGMLFLKAQAHSIPRDGGLCEEFKIDFPAGGDRESFLAVLRDQGWQPAGETDLWDLEKHGSRLLMATEYGVGPAKRLLIRVWGPARLTFSAEILRMRNSTALRLPSTCGEGKD